MIGYRVAMGTITTLAPPESRVYSIATTRVKDLPKRSIPLACC
ncbi:hypothetical protein MB901379_03192 [Mycobacterium basiliense]|uniref:Uncharacterized protein n=1 Tax=Mycobacterium basiliense TaxID=2094119 RepID=A0A447GGP3_9MYCO|nr:hypothetical protein MB901379_03192 [Mycobacterium basiliense]